MGFENNLKDDVIKIQVSNICVGVPLSITDRNDSATIMARSIRLGTAKSKLITNTSQHP